jgi:para-aminobenzoate synthetase component 1
VIERFYLNYTGQQRSKIKRRKTIFARMNQAKAIFRQMNILGKARVPFLFVLDYELQKPLVIPLDEIDPQQIRYNINGIGPDYGKPDKLPEKTFFYPLEADEKHYMQAFKQLMFHLRRGDSYLLNLTMPVPVNTNLNLHQIFDHSQARYKLWLAEECVVFSPETFVTIQDGKISTFPMKGTIKADREGADQQLIDDPKEKAEHYTIVDLLRNDLNSIAVNIRVDKFRFLQKVFTWQGALWQTSSKISGELPANYLDNLGNLFQKLLPAGSISGAPKKRTLELIQELEKYQRGYYTGVMGVFDGQNVDSGVMIRFVEQTKNGLVYKAGGGITVNSHAKSEFQELLEKVYLPFAIQEVK